jgi:hypothetical protein
METVYLTIKIIVVTGLFSLLGALLIAAATEINNK